MTTTRDPLAVLRQLRGTYAGGGDFPPVAQVDEAIAQVEALASAAQTVAANQDASFSSEWDCLDAALAPFSPGQDSEGGDHG